MEESARDIVESALGSSVGGTATNERVAEALSRLDHSRTSMLRRLLQDTIDAIRSGDMDAQLSCSTALAGLLSKQLVSGQETGLYNVCRVAWDHAHVGTMLQESQKELDRLTLLQAWDANMKEIIQGLEQAERGTADGYRTLVKNVESIQRMVLVDDESKRKKLEEIEERVRSAVKTGLVGRFVFQGGMPVEKDGEGETLGVLWECCSVLGILDDTANLVSDVLYESSILGVLKKVGVSRSHPVGYREKVLYKVLKGVADTVAGGDGTVIEAIGRYLWSLIAKQYIHMMDTGDIGIKQMMFAKKLEAKASILGFLPKGEKGPVALAMAEYVKEEMVKRRAAIVTRARDALVIPLQEQKVVSFEQNESLVLWSSHDVATDVVQRVTRDAMQGECPGMSEDVLEELKMFDTPLGVFESMFSVLESYKKTVEYMVEELEKTSELSDGQYVYFANSMMEDVASLIISLVRFDMQSQPLVAYHAALVYMSCLYVSRCCSILAFTGRMSIQVSGHVAGEKVRRLGEEVFTSILLSHTSDIEDDVFNLCSWRQQEDVQDIIRMKKSVQKIRHAFRRVGSSLSGEDIPDWLFIKIISILLENTLKPILGSIFELGDISEDLSENIPRVLEDLVPGTDSPEQDHGLLECAMVGKFGTRDGHHDTFEVLSGQVPTVKKLSELCHIMHLTSRDIVDQWNQGTVSSFSRDELIMLIQALFEDTPQVRSSLAMLRE